MNKIATIPMWVQLRKRAKRLRMVNALTMASALLVINHCQCDWTRAIHGTIKSPRRVMVSPFNMAKKRVTSIALRPQKHSSATVNHQKKE